MLEPKVRMERVQAARTEVTTSKGVSTGKVVKGAEQENGEEIGMQEDKKIYLTPGIESAKYLSNSIATT